MTYYSITGPGDEVPDQMKSDADMDENDDVESNCWMPLGVKLQPAHFLFKVCTFPLLGERFGYEVQFFPANIGTNDKTW